MKELLEACIYREKEREKVLCNGGLRRSEEAKEKESTWHLAVPQKVKWLWSHVSVPHTVCSPTSTSSSSHNLFFFLIISP